MARWAIVCVLLLGCGSPPKVIPSTAADVRRAARAPGAKVVLVNLWATWCAPCREEFPDLVRLQREFAGRGLRVIFVSWDEEAATAAEFLRRQGVTTLSFIKSSKESDQRFLEVLEPGLTGAIPATMVYDSSGRLRSFREGRTGYVEFEKMVLEVLNDKSQEAK